MNIHHCCDCARIKEFLDKELSVSKNKSERSHTHKQLYIGRISAINSVLEFIEDMKK